MEQFILNLIGSFLIWSAVDIYREEDSKVKIWSKEFWIQCILIILAIILISHK